VILADERFILIKRKFKVHAPREQFARAAITPKQRIVNV